MTTGEKGTAQWRSAIIGGGISGLGAAWALHHDPDRFYFRLFEAQDSDWRQCDYRRHAAGRRQLDSVRHFRHRLHPVAISPRRVVDEVVRHGTDRYHLQLQREVPWASVHPRFRLRDQSAATFRNCAVPTDPAASALVRPADPFIYYGSIMYSSRFSRAAASLVAASPLVGMALRLATLFAWRVGRFYSPTAHVTVRSTSGQPRLAWQKLG